MTYKLDERLAYKFPEGTLWSNEVSDTQQWKHQSDRHSDEQFADNVPSPESRTTLIPQCRQQLLAVGMGNKL